jgi:hypothetical protein
MVAALTAKTPEATAAQAVEGRSAAFSKTAQFAHLLIGHYNYERRG